MVHRCALCCHSVRNLSRLHESTELLVRIASIAGSSALTLRVALEERQSFEAERSCQKLHDWGEQIHEKDGEDQRLEDVLQVDEHAAHAEGGAANQGATQELQVEARVRDRVLRHRELVEPRWQLSGHRRLSHRRGHISVRAWVGAVLVVSAIWPAVPSYRLPLAYIAYCAAVRYCRCSLGIK